MVKNLVGDSGSILYEEFVGRLCAQEASRERGSLSREFAVLDTDGDGVVTTAEVAALLARPGVKHSEDLDAAAVLARCRNRQSAVPREGR